MRDDHLIAQEWVWIGYSRNPRFDQNTVRDSRNINGIQNRLLDTRGFDCYPGSRIRPNLGKDAGMGKKTIFGIAIKKVQDARECRIGIPFQSQTLLGQKKVAIV